MLNTGTSRRTTPLPQRFIPNTSKIDNMNKLLLTACAILLAAATYAQGANATFDVAAWNDVLTLDQTQLTAVATIEQTREQQLRELAQIEQSDNALYQRKLAGINSNAVAKLRNLLRPEQLNIYKKHLNQTRENRINLAKKMQAEGAGKADIDRVLNQ